MKRQVLFVQGSGEGAHKEDGELVKSLRAELGTNYPVHYPKLPNDGDAEYEAVKNCIADEIARLDNSAILVAHSAGAAALLKYLSEEKVAIMISGIFLLAAPYIGKGGWDMEEGALRAGFAAHLPKAVPMFFYHSRDDETVPFEHLALFAKELPEATVRKFDGRGHQFGNDLSEVAQDIKGLPDSRESS